MNKYQKYIEAIKNNYPPSNYTELRKALDECIELLERATPMRAINIRFDNLSDAFGGKCQCGCVVYEYHIFCPDCGKALDWSEK